jgi:subtilisin family serine protease
LNNQGFDATRFPRALPESHYQHPDPRFFSGLSSHGGKVMAKITINGISVDPATQGPALASANLVSPDSSTSDYILIQTSQPLDRTQKDELAALGVTILEYVPTNTYICHYPPSDLNRIRALPYVEWANVYLKDFKISPRLRSPSSAPEATNLLSLGEIETSMAQEPVQVDVVLHNNAAAPSVRDKVAAAARLDPAGLRVSGKKVRLVVQRQHLENLAAIAEVRHIEEHVAPKLHNRVALSIMGADATHLSAELEGAGQVVAVCDTGFDEGGTTNVHPAFGNRVLKLYALGRVTASDPHGHGTHVAGSVLGDGSSDTMGGQMRGAAPKASLVLQSVLDARGGLGGLPEDLNDLFLIPYQDDGARVHTNSWGSPVFGRYTQESFEADEFVWAHRDSVICFSAGNEGADVNANGVVDAGSVGSPGTAKNCITVGASESNRPSMSKEYGEAWPQDYPVDPLASDWWADNPDGMAAFSSRGPTRDGRIKPDVVAPGTAILSAHSRIAHVGSFWGASSDPLYCFMGGTSMATPLVAGCAAVVREYFQSKHSHQPSAALVKAMLINGARDISGQYVPSEAEATPNLSEGFGRVDLAATVGPFGGNERVDFRDENTVLDTAEEERMVVTINASGTILKVTLVWTDPAGEVLQNDLDLIIRAANGQERHGNMPPSSTEFDRKNNVEQVVWTDVPVGDVEIAVRAHRITLHPQSYALVVRTS